MKYLLVRNGEYFRKKARLVFLGAMVASAAVLSSCVSQDPSLNITGNQQLAQNQVDIPLSAPEGLGAAAGDGSIREDTQVAIVETASGEKIGVPVRAPRVGAAQAQTANVTATSSSPNALAIVDPAASEVLKTASAEPGNASQTRITESFSPSSGDRASTVSQGGETELAALDPNLANTSSAAGELTPQAEVAPPAKPRKSNRVRRIGRGSDEAGGFNNRPRASKRTNGGLFASLRKSNKPRVTITNRSGNTVRAGLSSGSAALPGVKSNAELFGINDAERDDDLQTTQVAAVGSFGRLSPNGLRVQHEKVEVACLKPGVIQILKVVERHYGSKPIITSGYRSPKRNRRAGGARNSQHIFCKAVDIQVEGVSKWDLAKYLRTIPGRGGVGTYCRTKSVHIDIGTRRDWHHPCRRSSVRKRKRT